MLDAALLAGLNHLLRSESWARQRLANFAGRQVRFEMSPFHLDLAIDIEGLFFPASATTTPDVTICLPTDAPLLLLRGIDKLLAVARVAGNAEFATELAFVLRHLRWDVEEDLSHIVGDIAAHRLMQGASRILAWQNQAANNLVENLAEYLVQENPLLVATEEFATLRDSIIRFNNDLIHIESRLAALAR